MPRTLEEESVVVRRLRWDDRDAVIKIDAKIMGRSRSEYLNLKLEENLDETGIKISLASEIDGLVVGFLLARVYYGEFGSLEPAAVLDTIGVNPDFLGRGVGSALLDQLCTDLNGLNVRQLRTEVGWDNPSLMTFFQRTGFVPAPRYCLVLDPSSRRSGLERKA